MKTMPPPRMRYRPPEHWPLYFVATPYEPPVKKHTYVRISVPPQPDKWVCVDCGTTEIRACSTSPGP